MFVSFVMEMSVKNVYWLCMLFYCIAGLKYQNGVSATHKNRDKREIMVPKISVNISCNATEFLSSGDGLQYKFCFQHTISSTADAFNAHLKWIFPLYIAFQSLDQRFGPESGLDISLHSSVMGMKIDHLPQNGTVCFNLTFLFDPEASLQPGRHFIVSHTLLYWADHALSHETEYSNPWHAFSVAFEVPGCSNDLGISSGAVKDYMITSSSHIPDYEAFKARLGSGWCAADLDLNQFLQVDFIHQVTVTKISIDSPDILEYTLQYSTDNQNWKNYSQYGSLKAFSRTPDNVTTHWIMHPFNAYNIRVRPKLWNNSMCLTIELYGCEDHTSQASCNVPLGMESGFITDAALSASQPNTNSQDSRLNKKIFLGSSVGGWFVNPYPRDPIDYLQIDLAVLYRVTKIGVQGEWTDAAPSDKFVKHYTVMISNDSVTWENHTQDGKATVFDGPTSSAMGVYPTFATLLPAVVTTYLRVYPQQIFVIKYRFMRLEIYGCLNEPMPSYQVSEDFSRRSYLLNEETGDIYVCIYSDDRTESSCMVSNDGYTWKSFRSRIVNILAIDATKGAIYALDSSNMHFRSLDNGQSWMGISLSQWTKSKTLSQMIFAKKVPENVIASDHVNGDVSVSRDGSQWTVSNIGIHLKRLGQNWEVAAKWKCCSNI